MANYNTLYDFYTVGQKTALPSVQERAKIYEQQGLGGMATYTGTSAQNVALLGKLQAPVAPPIATPTATPTTGWQTSPFQAGATFGQVQPPPISQASADQTPGLNLGAFPDIQTDLKQQTSFQDYLKQFQASLPTAPAQPSMVEQYKGLRTEAGLGDLETQLTDVSAQIKAMNNRYTEAVREIQESPISKVSSSARLSKLQREMANEYAPLQEQQSFLSDQLKTKTASIETLMSLTGKDYEMARSDYEFEFNKTIQMYNIFSAEKDKELTMTEKLQDNARANLQIITNQMTAGNVNWESLNESQQIQINQMELKAGFPTGFMSAITKTLKPKEDIVATYNFTDNAGNEVASIVTRTPDGGFESRNIILGKKKVTGTGGTNGVEPIKTDEWTWAKELVETNPDASEEELINGIRENTKLSISDAQRIIKEGRPEQEETKEGLIAWAKEQFDKGYKDSEIKAMLVKQGYPSDWIKEAIDRLKKTWWEKLWGLKY